jgi:mRNA-degrading endonuclease RelE of RelBE toxin-antitoxin system
VAKATGRQKNVVEKLKKLPAEKLAQVEDFIDFIAERDERQLVAAAARFSEKSFAKVWDNSEDSAYDRL